MFQALIQYSKKLNKNTHSPFRGLGGLLLFLFPVLSAQTITDGQTTVIYSLPKTEFIIQGEVEKVTETPGEFYQYSERYLATTDVITANRVYYQLKNLVLIPKTVVDKERTFSIVPPKKSLASNITVNDQGILCGINVPPAQIQKEVRIERKLNETTQQKKLLPLSEEYMLAGSVAKMAEGAAKQIYRIRENKVDLLSGDVEYMPKDGASMKTMVEQMSDQEKELTQLFTGTKTVELSTQTTTFTPSEAVKDKVAFRFSSFEGIVPADDLSGSPYYISISFEPVKVETSEKKKKEKVEVFSVIPVSAKVSLYNSEKVFYQNEIILPQLGELMPLPLETLDKYSKVYVSPETGRMLSVEQGKK